MVGRARWCQQRRWNSDSGENITRTSGAVAMAERQQWRAAPWMWPLHIHVHVLKEESYRSHSMYRPRVHCASLPTTTALAARAYPTLSTVASVASDASSISHRTQRKYQCRYEKEKSFKLRYLSSWKKQWSRHWRLNQTAWMHRYGPTCWNGERWFSGLKRRNRKIWSKISIASR
jgi:hypothetical protein